MMYDIKKPVKKKLKKQKTLYNLKKPTSAIACGPLYTPGGE